MLITTDAQARAIKLLDGQPKRKDRVGNGLYLLTNKSGKYWRYSYRYDGKTKDYSIGTYPAVSLKEAKLALAIPKALLKDGIDPNQRKKELREANKAAARKTEQQATDDSNTLGAVGEMWFETMRLGWANSHADKQLQRLNKHLYPKIGHIPIKSLDRQQIVDAMLLICETSSPDIGRRISQMCRQILNYACNRGLIEYVPMGDMKGILPPVVSKKLPCITDHKRLGEYLKAIYNDTSGTYTVSMAMKILPYFGARVGEFSMAEWCEIDFDTATWVIPSNHRKLKKQKKTDDNCHTIPLSKQAIKLLRELQRVTGNGRHVFPSVKGDSSHMSNEAVNKRIAALGFKGEMVAHSWRSVFSTYMNSIDRNPDAIERHLAHVEKNQVRASYNRNDYIEQRIAMMQEYADWLDGLRA